MLGAVTLVLVVSLGSEGGTGADCAPAETAQARAVELLASGQQLMAAVQFSLADVLACEPTGRERARFGYALAMFRLGERAEVERVLRPLVDSSAGGTRRQARLLRAIAAPELPGGVEIEIDRLRLDLWHSRGDAHELRRKLSEWPEGPPEPLARIAGQLESAPSRSAVLAGIFSAVVPGLGQAYVGAWQSAAVAFILNALVVGAAVELFSQRLWIAGAAAAAVGSITYVGNIINAADSAAMFNASRRRPAEDALERALFPEFFPPSPGS